MSSWDDLNAWYGQGRALIEALKPPAPVTAGTWMEYDRAFGTKAHVRWDALSSNNGATVYNPPMQDFTRYDTVPNQPSPIAMPGDVCATANWSGSIEYHRIQQVPLLDGNRWGFVDGFGGQSVPGSFYPCETVRADWMNLDTGAVIDITPQRPAPQGYPYCVFDIPTSGHFRRRCWGWVWNSMSSGRQRPFYQQSDFWFGVQTTDPAWLGAPPQTRQGVKESDSWWDSGKWVHATSSQHPFDDNNEPVVVTDLNYTGFDIHGRGLGSGADYQYEGWHVGVALIVDTAG